jgi:hypothetical protein
MESRCVERNGLGLGLCKRTYHTIRLKKVRIIIKKSLISLEYSHIETRNLPNRNLESCLCINPLVSQSQVVVLHKLRTGYVAL